MALIYTSRFPARALVDLLQVQIRIRESKTEVPDDIDKFHGFELGTVERPLVYHADTVANRNIRSHHF